MASNGRMAALDGPTAQRLRFLLDFGYASSGPTSPARVRLTQNESPAERLVDDRSQRGRSCPFKLRLTCQVREPDRVGLQWIAVASTARRGELEFNEPRHNFKCFACARAYICEERMDRLQTRMHLYMHLQLPDAAGCRQMGIERNSVQFGKHTGVDAQRLDHHGCF